MPEHNVSLSLAQVFNIDDPRSEMIGDSIRARHGAKLEGIVKFGTSREADLRCLGVPDSVPQYVAGTIIGDGKNVYIEVGGENAPNDLEIHLTQFSVQRFSGTEEIDLELLNEPKVLKPGDKIELYDLTAVPELTDPDKLYVAQFGDFVNYYPSLEQQLLRIPRVDGKLPRFTLAIEHEMIYPVSKLIGLIPEGKATRVVTADIHMEYRFELPKGVIAGTPGIRIDFRAIGDHTLNLQPLDEVAQIARISEEASRDVKATVYVGNRGETPQQLARRYIMSDLYPHFAREASMATTNISPDKISYRIVDVFLQAR